MPAYELSAGDYPAMKYWAVACDSKRLLIQSGRIPWGTLLFLQVFLGGLGFAMLWPVWHARERGLFALMCFPIGFACLGCIILPIRKILTERSKGAILSYDQEREIVALPRARLSLPKAQILEFRILQEYDDPASKIKGCNAAELQVIYRNPKEKSLTLLRVSGTRPFDDVVEALKRVGLARIVLAEQQPNRSEWKVSEL